MAVRDNLNSVGGVKETIEMIASSSVSPLPDSEENAVSIKVQKTGTLNYVLYNYTDRGAGSTAYVAKNGEIVTSLFSKWSTGDESVQGTVDVAAGDTLKIWRNMNAISIAVLFGYIL